MKRERSFGLYDPGSPSVERDYTRFLINWLPPPLGDRISHHPSGTILIKCGRSECSKHKNTLRFIPTQNKHIQELYLKATDDARLAVESNDVVLFQEAEQVILQHALARCFECRKRVQVSKAKDSNPVSQCKAEWTRIKTQEFRTCSRCGADRALEANHLPHYAENAKAYAKCVTDYGIETAEKMFPASERKLRKVSDVCWWACKKHGGVEGLRLEALKCMPLCSMCHALDECSNTAPENRSSVDKVKSRTYKNNDVKCAARRFVENKIEKHEFVDKLKRDVGECQRVECPKDGPSGGKCSEGFEVCYEWDHIQRPSKGRGVAEICNHNGSLEQRRDELLEEIRKCRMLCSNCHQTRSKWDV